MSCAYALPPARKGVVVITLSVRCLTSWSSLSKHPQGIKFVPRSLYHCPFSSITLSQGSRFVRFLKGCTTVVCVRTMARAECGFVKGAPFSKVSSAPGQDHGQWLTLCRCQGRRRPRGGFGPEPLHPTTVCLQPRKHTHVDTHSWTHKCGRRVNSPDTCFSASLSQSRWNRNSFLEAKNPTEGRKNRKEDKDTKSQSNCGVNNM